MTLRDKLAQLPALIPEEAVLNAEIEHKQKQLEKSRAVQRECLALIDGVEDPILHNVLVLRCVQGLPWEQVAKETPGSMSAQGCRKMYSRWIARKEVRICEN